MYKILSASKDNYITNKIIRNSFRATDANTGEAGTLDLFKLYDESSLTGTNEKVVELSRILIKFDLDPLRRLTGSILDFSDSSFKCNILLHDVYGGQTTPSNFKLIAFPLSKSFDEGIGRDVVQFQDIDSSNFITASITDDTVSAWNITGANAQGFLNSDDIDIISSGILADGETVNLWKSQVFSKGDEDLNIDVTTIVSATLAGLIPDLGFRISFSGSQETDTRTRFVKRFASRNTSNTRIHPKLIAKWDDSTQDHHRSMFFDVTGTLFLNNYHRGTLAHILSGAAATSITESNSLLITIMSGSDSGSNLFRKYITASQHQIGTNYITGVYSGTFCISEFESGTLREELKNAGSATFKEIWSSLDRTVGFYTGSLIINKVQRSAFVNTPKRLFVNITNLRSEYRASDKVRFRVFVEDIERVIVATKTPIETKSEIFTKMYYRVRDYDSGDVIIPFDSTSNATLLSTDVDGMYFDFYMDGLQRGRTYTFDFEVIDQNSEQVFTEVAAKFRVV